MSVTHPNSYGLSKSCSLIFEFESKLALEIWIAGFPVLSTGGPSAAAEVIGLPMGPGLRMDPYFVDDPVKTSNLSVHSGQKAYLECRVRNLGAKKVIN